VAADRHGFAINYGGSARRTNVVGEAFPHKGGKPMRNEPTAKLHAAIAQVHCGHETRGRCYPEDLRRRIVAHVVAERSKGVSMVSTARSLGVPYQTLLGWMQAVVFARFCAS
jgi:hypothetical protein